MLPNVDFTKTQAYKYLADHYINMASVSLKDLFANDNQRFAKFSLQFEDILLDFSKNRVDEQTLALLIQLAKECSVKEAIGAMFSGEKINATEGRPVLHIALRNRSNKPIYVDGKDVMDSLQIKPGPKVGEILGQLFQEVLEDDKKNDREYLLSKIKQLG